ncbi:unnamed protein product [Dovyalis caffra]|uniref:Uncharacterized protein n=1 Tax=Dovyalis caffra TaxID=77055 RepID=A0AAV1S234_9ROSI|nr:unnamed protein product [Dovyalis caffra]
MKKAELVFIPLPTMGHVVAAVEMAKLMVEREDRISTNVLIINPTIDSSTTKYIDSLTESTLPNRFRVVPLPRPEHISETYADHKMLPSLVEAQNPNIKEFVSKLKTQSELSPDSPRLAGFVLDMFVTGIKNLAEEFGVPWYVFFVSSAAYLGCVLHLQALHDEKKVDLTQFENSDAEMQIKSLVNRFPAKLLPDMVFDREPLATLLEVARGSSAARGILINTFTELEPHAVNSLSNSKIPPIYPIGPIVKCEGNGYDVRSDSSIDYRDIMQWLDDQPPSSVVFLCFGSWGSFDVEQVKEIACALEHCGHRFLWSLRKPSIKVATWPIYAEQQFIAFEMVIELGLSVDLKMDYRENILVDDGNEVIVNSDDIKRGLKSVMEQDNEIRKKVKKMSRISKKALMDGGSSSSALAQVIEDVMATKHEAIVSSRHK